VSRSAIALAALLALVATGCADQLPASDPAATEPDAQALQVVVTTSVLGDVARQVLAPDEDVEVEVLLPPGADPHGYAPSAADGVALREADVVYAIGLGLEEALADSLEAAEEEGVRVVRLGPLVDPLPFGGAGDLHGDDEEEENHAGEDEHADDEDDHGPLDPHVWLDPIRVAQLGQEVAAVHAELAPDAAGAVAGAADDLETRMRALDEELGAMVEQLPADRRLLVTNHDALGYLAARYDLDVVATVLPGTSADVDVTAGAFTGLVELLLDTGIPAVFAETTSSDRLARALAEEVPGVQVVELYTGALGEPGSGADSIEGMLRTDVERIVDALG